jgi:hypothetical protein
MASSTVRSAYDSRSATSYAYWATVAGRVGTVGTTTGAGVVLIALGCFGCLGALGALPELGLLPWALLLPPACFCALGEL